MIPSGGRIFNMLKQFFGSRKSLLLVLAGVILLALLALVWRVVSLERASSEVVSEPILKISYCGAEPEELCVLSFGRDAEEKMIINLFAPDRTFPGFYLKIKRITGESVYECEKNKEVPTSVFCYGDMINLQEKMEISLLSKDDGRLIAAGNFTLNAILISAQPQNMGDDSAPTPAIFNAGKSVSTDAFETLTVTPDLTPDPSYPNPSYP